MVDAQSFFLDNAFKKVIKSNRQFGKSLEWLLT
jgi:hypothetical protein